MDLSGGVSKIVADNQNRGTGTPFIVEVDGIFSEYSHSENHIRAERFNAKLDSEINWIEKFTKHAPSVGNHYEKILSDLIEEYLPSSIKVGTGFVYDSLNERCSPQLDIICYRDDLISPIFRRNDFVIVQSESVISSCEVKKTLKQSDLKNWINKIVGCNMGSNVNNPQGIQDVGVFAYFCDSKSNTIASNVVDALTNYLRNFSGKTVLGSEVIFNIYNLCLPSIFIRNSNEYIKTTLTRKDPKSIEGLVRVSRLCSSGVNGVSPLLSMLSNALLSLDFDRRDHCSSPLVNVVEDITVKVPLIPMQYISSMKLIAMFPDAECLLKETAACGVLLSSFENPHRFRTLESLSLTPGFTWKTVKRDVADRTRQAGIAFQQINATQSN